MMELLQLKYFCDAAKTENFTATAKRFFVPTSAVSQSIKRLEAELGVKLFTREANRISLNERGKAFFAEVGQALTMLDNAAKRACDDGERGEIRISIFINRRTVMQTVERFRKIHPDVNIVTKYAADPTKEAVDLIVTDKDLGRAFEGSALIKEDILLAMHKDHPLASLAQISCDDLKGIPFICTNQGSSLYRITNEICSDIGFKPHIAICSDDPYYIRKCVEMGLGVALIPAVSWKGQFSENILFKKIHAYRRFTYLYYKKGEYLPLYMQEFCEMLAEECKREETAL
ncbi:MAG: LysR family transcriptional regulator [Clostridia bacterium]|nr:LysR family transcriptional regulator [Clostridia bacterium]